MSSLWTLWNIWSYIVNWQKQANVPASAANKQAIAQPGKRIFPNLIFSISIELQIHQFKIQKDLWLNIKLEENSLV